MNTPGSLQWQLDLNAIAPLVQQAKETTGLNVAATPREVTLIFAREQLRVLPVPQRQTSARGNSHPDLVALVPLFMGHYVFHLTQSQAVPASSLNVPDLLLKQPQRK